VPVSSPTAWTAYGLDKRRASSGGRRVPERTLHLLALLGGWPGALLGQRRFRHKTQKVSFRIVFWVVVVLHVAAVGAAAYALVGLPRLIRPELPGRYIRDDPVHDTDLRPRPDAAHRPGR
jgi:uncharacterized membrane protein YsdA (DUF1294 family)